jgi:acetyltransferase-like isoleucine patch superfamily enzyme
VKVPEGVHIMHGHYIAEPGDNLVIVTNLVIEPGETGDLASLTVFEESGDNCFFGPQVTYHQTYFYHQN